MKNSSLFFYMILLSSTFLYSMEPDPKDAQNNPSRYYPWGALYQAPITQAEQEDHICLKLLPNLDTCSRAAEFGCNNGYLSYLLACQYSRLCITGIEYQQGRVDQNRKKYFFMPKMSFIHNESLQKTERYNNRFDFVFSNNAHHWVQDKMAVLRTMIASLNPGGYLHINADTQLQPTHPLMQTLKRVGSTSNGIDLLSAYVSNPRHFPLEKETTSKQLRAAGFVDSELKEINTEFVFADRVQFKRWVSECADPVMVVAMIKKEERESLITQIVDNYEAIKGKSLDGSFSYDLPQLVVRARKPA